MEATPLSAALFSFPFPLPFSRFSPFLFLPATPLLDSLFSIRLFLSSFLLHLWHSSIRQQQLYNSS
uniref:Uncharacterized protein n=1 Tax=Solanum lycopersicum TaxID=4081 RepID=A0A3Q7FGP3_SOLLC